MRWAKVGLAIGAWLVVAACESDVATPDGSGGGTTGQGAGAPFPTGDCDTDADCAGDFRCLELTEGGYRVCEEQRRFNEASSCSSQFDGCCSTAECTAGQTCAYERDDWVSCTDEGTPGDNACRDLGDSCASDDDCIFPISADLVAPGICSPDGAFGFNGATCRIASCRKHSDCTAKPGGVCGPVEDACSCGLRQTITCIYPDGCMYNADCPEGLFCQMRLDLGHSVCQQSNGCD